MDMQLHFFPPIPCVRCGASFQPGHPEILCPRCGLPARFSLLRQGATAMPAAPIGGQDLAEVAAPVASSSHIPVVPAVASEQPFSGDELQSLLRLRERYEQGDLNVRDEEFSEEERARLQFVRWLYRSGRVEP